MKTKNIVITVVILIVVIGIVVWALLAGKKEVPSQTCEELAGICCSSDQTCQGGVFKDSSDCGKLCCVDGICVKSAKEDDKKDDKKEEENPYDSAKEVKPASALNTEFHNDFKAVLGSVFGGAKLKTASSDKYSEELDYIVKREITEEDAQEIKDLLEEKEYETTSSSAEADEYAYEFSKEVLGEEYKNINVRIWLEGEGRYQQRVSISVYK